MTHKQYLAHICCNSSVCRECRTIPLKLCIFLSWVHALIIFVCLLFRTNRPGRERPTYKCKHLIGGRRGVWILWQVQLIAGFCSVLKCAEMKQRFKVNRWRTWKRTCRAYIVHTEFVSTRVVCNNFKCLIRWRYMFPPLHIGVLFCKLNDWG